MGGRKGGRKGEYLLEIIRKIKHFVLSEDSETLFSASPIDVYCAQCLIFWHCTIKVVHEKDS